MAKALLLSEKPSLGRAIMARYNKGIYKDQVDCIYLHGHICGLAEPQEYDESLEKWSADTLPWIPENFKYVAIDKALVKQIKDAIKNNHYDYLINCTDPEREGQAIFYNVYFHLGLKLPVKRLWVNDLNDEGIDEAWQNLKDDQHDPFLKNLTSAALCREWMDQLVGINFTRAISLKNREVQPVGRVMSPTLQILADRERKIRDFKPVTTYDVVANFKENYSGTYIPAGDDEEEHEGSGAFTTKEQAEDFIAGLGKGGTIVEFSKKKTEEQAKLLYSLGELQSDASSTYGMTATESLNLVQGLYEKKILTYPRTDSSYIPDGDVARIQKFINNILKTIPDISGFANEINKNKVQDYKKSKYVNSKKVQAHGAIIFTGGSFDYDKLSAGEKKIVQLVGKRIIATVMDPCVSNRIKITTDIDGYKFNTNLTQTISPGWKVLYNFKEKEVNIPELKKGQKVSVNKYDIAEKITKCPPRFTDGSLIKAMINIGNTLDDKELKDALKGETPDQGGIGTPATRAAIIEKLLLAKKSRGNEIFWVTRDKQKKLHVTDDGLRVADMIKDYSFSSAVMTAEWESKLSKIVDGDYSEGALMSEMKEFITENINEIKEQIPQRTVSASPTAVVEGAKCPCCGGKIWSGERSFRCENFVREGKGCKFSLAKTIGGSDITEEDILKLCAGEQTEPHDMTSKDGRPFKGVLECDKKTGKIQFAGSGKSSAEDAKIKCKCGGAVISQEGKYGKYYRCPDCRKIVSAEWCGHKFTKPELKTLFADKETAALDFVSSAGKSFRAKIKLEEGKIKPNFESKF